MSFFKAVNLAPADAIFGLNAEFVADQNSNKINLLIGAYKNEEGNSHVLPVVRHVEKAIAADETLGHDYLPIEGMKELCIAASKLVLGENCDALVENRVAYVQSISGTGAIRLALAFLQQHHPVKTVYVSKQTWVNHRKLALHTGYTDIREYEYFDQVTKGLDINGLLSDLDGAPEGSILVLHACAHNPCGVDPTNEDWKTIFDKAKSKKLVCLFDIAYGGFASGDPDIDAWCIRYFVKQGLEVIFAQSFSKNFGLYNERCGNLGFVCKNSTIAMNVKSHLKALIRPMYSNPPNHGARIVATILNNKTLYAEWREQLQAMVNRIQSARHLIHKKLKEIDTPGDWSHILNQKGMFTFTGLNAKQVSVLKEKYHLYMLPNGRINMCGINSTNVDTIANAFKDVVMNFKD